MVPDFWLANVDKVEAYLRERVTKGIVHEVGRTVLDRPLNVVEYNPQARAGLLVVGGTHGHEPGTVASCMNLIHALETGADLDGRPHEHMLGLLERVHLYVAPMLNPDGRGVNMDSYYAMGTGALSVFANGVTKEGSLVPYQCSSDEPLYYFDANDALFMGGQLNAAGYAMNRRRSPDHSDAIEVQHLFEFVKDLGLDAAMDLHACGSNFGMQVREHEPVYWPIMREWQRRAEKVFAEKGRPLRPLQGDGDPPKSCPFHFNATMFHRHAHLMWVIYEGRQGYLGHPDFLPFPTQWEIIDDYLTAITVFIELGVEGRYAKANKEVFG